MPDNDDPQLRRDPHAFLAGGGEMGKLIRAFDWSQTVLGPIESWHGSLRTAVSICLASDLPICIIWGPELVQIYNDGYRLICGGKHPRSLGQNFAECWREAWPVIGDAHDSALSGDTAFLETQQVFLERRGYTEECFFTFSFSPIRDDTGRVSGLFHPVIEMTAKVQGERRTQVLRDVATRTAKATTVDEACRLTADALSGHDRDIPFALLYLFDDDSESARLVASTGIAADSPASPHHVSIVSATGRSWPMADVVRQQRPVVIEDVEERFGPVACGPYPESPRIALAQPLKLPGSARPVGVLVTGISSRLELNRAYLDFHDLLAAAVTTAVTNGRAFEEARQRADALAELDRAKTAFFSNVSHEFRTPLTLMLGPVEDMLARSHTDLSPATKGQLEIVNRNGLRLLRLVNTLLDFSRIEAGRARAAFEPTDLAAFTAELASVFRAACDRAGLALTVDCPPIGEPVFVDRDMWEKVVLNLLSNAFKFTFDGQIAVSLTRIGSTVALQVRDSGTGIPASEMPRLFERFHRIENARGRTHEGSGIGLSLVEELVTLHGGVITAQSSVGEGTTFTVSLSLGSAHLPPDQLADGRRPATSGTGAMPYVEEALRWLPDYSALESDLLPDRTAVFVSSVEEEREGDDRPRVLVVDDNADMRQYVVRLLSEHFRTDAVADGEAALASARDRLPDLVLTDVMMPRLDGFGLLRALRADPRLSSVPVIMLSARAGEESRVEGMEAGADDYLVKPFSSRELLARVTAHLQMARLRHEANETLRESGDRLRMALAAARMMAWQFEPSTGKLDLSDNADDMLGLPAGSTLPDGAAGFAMIHADDVEAHRAKVMKAYEERGSYVSTYRIVRRDTGAAQWMEERGHAVCHGPDQIVRLVGVAMDISERMRSEQEIQAKAQQTRTILESITDGFFALDRDWSFAYINAAGERFLNRTSGDLIGKRLWDEFPGTVGSEFERVYRRVASDRMPESFTAHYPDFDRWYDVSAYPAPDGLSVYFRDVTERKLTEAQLAASEERRRLALDDAELGAWNVDPSSHSIRTDTRFRTIFGTTEEWSDYDQIFSVIHPDDLSAAQDAVAAAIRLDDPMPYAIEYRITHADGSVRWVFAKGRSTIEGIGESRRVVSLDGTVADITDRKRAEAERENLLGQLQEHDKRKDEFLATLAHELRNPLAPMRNGLQIIKLAGPNDRIERARVMMDRQMTQMVRLVDDLLDVSRITLGKFDLRRERVDVRAVIDSAVEIVRPLLEQQRHELTVVSPDEPAYVDGDVTRLAQVVSNLLSNSAKYTHRGGHIRLSVELADGMVSIAVKDNGIGIPLNMLGRIFEMFTQVDRTLEKTTGGLGIGLSLAKGLVEMHGGTIEAHSEGEGEGSEFVVRLPAPPGAIGEGEHVHADEARAVNASHRRILVVDDNADAAESLAHLLTLSGNAVRIANDGDAGITAAESFHPDLILLDLGMPTLNGYDACRRIRAHAWGSQITIVAMTGWGQEDDKRRSREAGFDSHLVKPVDYRVLQELLRTNRRDMRPSTADTENR